jgi:hypothetical protein
MRVLITAALAYVPWAIAQTGSAIPPAAGQPVRSAAIPGIPVVKPNPPAAASETSVATLQGVCKTKAPEGGCKTVITRADLDAFTRAFAPQSPENVRGRLAVQYARSLAYATLAEQQGLDKDPALAKEVELQLKMIRMRYLATAYLQSIQKKLGAITGAEVQAYYDSHRELFEEAEVRRVSVPFAVPTADGHTLDHSAVRTEMEKIRARAAGGEDLSDLQQQAYKDLHILATPPQVTPVAVRRSSMQGEEAKVLDLKEGELSSLLDLPGAFAFAKLVARHPVPMDSVRQEIEAALRRQRMQNALSKLGTRITAQFNLEYLDLSSQPELFGDTPTTPRAARPVSLRRKPGLTMRTNPVDPKQ